MVGVTPMGTKLQGRCSMINTRAHAIIDYATGLLLLVAPSLSGFATGGIAQRLPQILGNPGAI